jgi:hypothetical protein
VRIEAERQDRTRAIDVVGALHGELQPLVQLDALVPLPPSYRVLAACYAHMGRLDEARAIVAQLRTITPVVVPDFLPWHNPDDRELLLSGLRLAMGEGE